MADKTIILFCGAGMSTSLLVNKMKEAAAAQGKDYEIHAHALSEEPLYAPTADVIMIGPQVRFELANMRKRNPDRKITDIPMRMYGTMDGKATLALAEKIMNEE